MPYVHTLYHAPAGWLKVAPEACSITLFRLFLNNRYGEKVTLFFTSHHKQQAKKLSALRVGFIQHPLDGFIQQNKHHRRNHNGNNNAHKNLWQIANVVF